MSRRCAGFPARRRGGRHSICRLSLVLDTALLQMTVPVALYELVFE
jgi:hypothetical protein